MGLKNPVGDRGLHHGVVDLCDLAVYIVDPKKTHMRTFLTP